VNARGELLMKQKQDADTNHEDTRPSEKVARTLVFDRKVASRRNFCFSLQRTFMDAHRRSGWSGWIL